jgi:heme oxygenase
MQMRNRTIETGTIAVIETIRGATRSRHAKLASLPSMLRLFEPTYTISEYRAHLARILGIFEPLEHAMAQAAHPDDPVRALQRSSDLCEDLRRMGASASDIAAVEHCSRIPHISAAGLRGYTYVILGSMLGGRIIVKHLRAVFGLTASFCFYGGGNFQYDLAWTSFCLELEENGRDDLQAICDTAIGIFDAYAAWLSEPTRKDGFG